MTPLRSRLYPFNRTENRIPMEIGVFLEGNRQVPGAESTFTENVSARGARIVSVRRWEPDDRLMLTAERGRTAYGLCFAHWRVSLLGSSSLLPTPARRRLCNWRGVS